MIGNDVVDLKQALQDSNWQRQRFLNKIFSEKEQSYINNAKNAHQMVWRLWSMKESAYKIHSRQYQKRVFNPKALGCKIIDDFKGDVCIKKTHYQTTSTLDDNFIHTVAVLNNKKPIITNCFMIKKNPYNNSSTLCYKHLKQAVAITTAIDEKSLSIKKDKAGVPHLYCYGKPKPLEILFSITHHGSYGAYAMIDH